MINHTLMRIVESGLGETSRWRFHQYVHLARNLRQKSPEPRICNICGFEGLFDPEGWPPRPEAKCPACSSLERHRLFKVWFDANSERLVGGRLLHFAPEEAITRLVREVVEEYISADIAPGRADLVLNIEEIDLPADSVDAIICFHVLEHVDDGRALSEMHRVLRAAGALLLMVPIVEGWNATYENPNIRSSHDRLLHFGQADHVRFFGADVRERIRAAGFGLEEYTADNPEQIARYSLIRGQKLFVATRTSARAA